MYVMSEDLLRSIQIHRKQDPFRFQKFNTAQRRFFKALKDPKPDSLTIVLFLKPNRVGGSRALVAGISAIMNGTDHPAAQCSPFGKFWPFPVRSARLLSTSETLGDTGPIQKAIRDLFPEGKYKQSRGVGKSYNSAMVIDAAPGNGECGWDMDMMSYGQDALSAAGSTKGLVVGSEPMPHAMFVECLTRLGGNGLFILECTQLDLAPYLEEMAEDAGGRSEGGIQYGTLKLDGKAVGEIRVVRGDIEESCFPVETEILTERGWRTIGSVKVGDIVAGVDDAQNMVWHPTTALVRRRHQGDMVRYDKRFPLATPDHAMWVCDLMRGPKMFFREAGKLRRSLRMIGNVNAQIGKSVYHPFPEMFSLDDWAEFMGWYISEGCCTGVKGGKGVDFTVHISQNQGPKMERIKALLGRMKFRSSHGHDWHRGKKSMYLAHRELHAHLFPLGWSHTKRIPRYLFGYPPSALTRLWESLRLGDGSTGSRYLTSSKCLADDVQELLLRLGNKVSIRGDRGEGKEFRGKNGKTYIGCEMYTVRAAHDRYYHIGKVEKNIFFSGEVGCVTVPSGRIIVRHPEEKYPLVVGNCAEHHNGHQSHSAIEATIAGWPAEEREARRTGKPLRLSGRIYPNWGEANELKQLTEAQAEWWQEGRVIISNVIDPADRKPWAVAWFATFPNEDVVEFAEWPPFDYAACKSSPVVDIESYRDILLQAEAQIGLPVQNRGIDGLFGKSIKSGRGLNIIQMLGAPCVGCMEKWGKNEAWEDGRCPHRLSYKQAPAYDGSVRDGHILVATAIGGAGVAPKDFTLLESCPNAIYGQRRYSWKENTREEKGLSSTPQLVNKDFPDLKRMFYLMGWNRWPAEVTPARIVPRRRSH